MLPCSPKRMRDGGVIERRKTGVNKTGEGRKKEKAIERGVLCPFFPPHPPSRLKSVNLCVCIVKM